MFPYIGVAVFPQTFIVETINLSDLSALVVSTENGNARFVANFQGYKQRDGFERIVAAVDVIAHKQIVSLRTVPSDSKKLGKVIELTVNVTANGYRTANRLDVALFSKNFFCLDDKYSLVMQFKKYKVVRREKIER